MPPKKPRKKIIPVFPHGYVAKVIRYRMPECVYIGEAPFPINVMPDVRRSKNNAHLREVLFDSGDAIEMELANDDNKAFWDYMKGLASRGVDPNYTRAILLYYSDPKRYTRFVDKEHGLPHSLIKEFEKSKKRLMRELEPKDYRKFVKIFETLKRKYNKNYDCIEGDKLNPKVVGFLMNVPERDRLTRTGDRGRKTNHFHNVMMLLLFRHFKKCLRTKVGTGEGVYLTIAKIMHEVFPVTYPMVFTRKHMETHMGHLRKNSIYVKRCFSFEKMHSDISRKLLQKTPRKEIECFDQLWTILEARKKHLISL